MDGDRPRGEHDEQCGTYDLEDPLAIKKSGRNQDQIPRSQTDRPRNERDRRPPQAQQQHHDEQPQLRQEHLGGCPLPEKGLGQYGVQNTGVQATQRVAHIGRGRPEIRGACRDIRDQDDLVSKLVAPKIELIPIFAGFQNIRKIVMLHDSPGTEEIDHHVPRAIHRYHDVTGYLPAPGPNGAPHEDVAPGRERDPIRRHAQIVTGHTERQARIERVTIARQQRKSTKHTVVIRPDREKPHPFRCRGQSRKSPKGARPDGNEGIVPLDMNPPGGIRQVMDELSIPGKGRRNAFLTREGERHAKKDVPGCASRIDQSRVFLALSAGGEDQVEHLGRRAHGGKIRDNFRVMLPVEVEILELLNRGVVDIHMDERRIIGWAQRHNAVAKTEQQIDKTGIPRFDNPVEKKASELSQAQGGTDEKRRGPALAPAIGARS